MLAQGQIREKNVPLEIKRKHITILERIGGGAFGDVCKGVYTDATFRDQQVAIKTLKVDEFSTESNAAKQELMREAAIMAQVQHPNVVNMLGVCTVGQPILLVLELCEHGSLDVFLRTRVGITDLSLNAKLRILLDVANGMAHLHSLSLVHRDLAARNVLLSATYTCKVRTLRVCFKIPPAHVYVYVYTYI